MKSKDLLLIFVLLTLGSYFLVKGLVAATAFLIPLVFAAMLTLICIPLSRKLEHFGVGRGIASFLCVILSLVAFLSIFVVVSAQISNVAEKWPEAQERLKPRLEKAQNFIREKTGISTQEQMQMIYGNAESDSTASPSSSSTQASSEMITEDAKKTIGLIVMDFFGFLGNATLTFIYFFFLLFYRHKVKLSILRFFSEEKKEKAKKVMAESIQLSVDFLVGRLTLILFLAIIYSIGMSIAGLENAILIAVIASLLSLIPFIGNIIGYLLAISLSVFGGAETWSLVVVTLTYGLAQFVESYILEPYVVGKKVDLNPLVTIVIVVLGSSIWGISGMILSIPVAGIMKIIFDATDGLKPLGYALGEEDLDDPDEQGFLSKWGEQIWNKIKGKSK
ncbi:AI-2E family transporter [Algoriphagus halophytocola]|uniref:AI-2E family transporter n=1 Tax=Algoriphagus halophytocola TaxID=2991499 RepID=A0ABY6MJA6_9BACT|nr:MULTISPECIES: AI-2E family transporter [unclassified Algoriphagus]UZD23569.1 AI-2E family transporter [Algoriphagus sp. TR-M5]WBL44863.1 AI-2E family transporter [Algoriphagus sp. TR-M9]